MHIGLSIIAMTLAACGTDSSTPVSCSVELVFDGAKSDQDRGLIIYSAPIGSCGRTVDLSGRLGLRVAAESLPVPGAVVDLTAVPGRLEFKPALSLSGGGTATDLVFEAGTAWGLPWNQDGESMLSVTVALPPGAEASLYPKRVVVTMRALDQ